MATVSFGLRNEILEIRSRISPRQGKNGHPSYIHPVRNIPEALAMNHPPPHTSRSSKTTRSLIARVRVYSSVRYPRADHRGAARAEKGEERERGGKGKKENATRKCACARGISKFTRYLHRSAGYRRCSGRLSAARRRCRCTLRAVAFTFIRG